MNWLERLFRRMFRRKDEIKPPLKGFTKPSPGPDLIGRQGGQARNRVHIYRQPFGYPIRLCDWVAVERGSIEAKGQCQGIHGPAEVLALAAALDWREGQGDRICRHCHAVSVGKRTSVGMDLHGHGKGAA